MAMFEAMRRNLAGEPAKFDVEDIVEVRPQALQVADEFEAKEPNIEDVLTKPRESLKPVNELSAEVIESMLWWAYDTDLIDYDEMESRILTLHERPQADAAPTGVSFDEENDNVLEFLWGKGVDENTQTSKVWNLIDRFEKAEKERIRKERVQEARNEARGFRVRREF